MHCQVEALELMQHLSITYTVRELGIVAILRYFYLQSFEFQLISTTTIYMKLTSTQLLLYTYKR